MLTEAQVPEVIKAVKAKLEEAAKRGVRLKVTGERLDDDWLYIVVTPEKAGTSATDHAKTMAHIEKELREAGYANVLLVPALDE